jgi:hypothetical protein
MIRELEFKYQAEADTELDKLAGTSLLFFSQIILISDSAKSI